MLAWDSVNSRWVKVQADEDGVLRTKPEGVYLAVLPTLDDGEQHRLILTQDGKLLADDPSTQALIDDIEAKLDHATYGLAALQVLLAAIPTTPELEADAAARYATLAAYVDEIESLLGNATYGLAALKILIDAVEAKLDALSDQTMQTEAVLLTEAAHLKVTEEDETDQTVTEDAYTEKYSVVVTPTSWMASYGRRATLVVEYRIPTTNSGTCDVKTLVDGGDPVETLNVGTAQRRHIHADITDLSAPITVSLEAKNDAAATDVIDYFHVYLQIGAASTSSVAVADITGVQSLSFEVGRVVFKVWTGATDTATLYIYGDADLMRSLSEAGSSITKARYDLPAECVIGVINSYCRVRLHTDNADNPAVLRELRYSRVWFA